MRLFFVFLFYLIGLLGGMLSPFWLFLALAPSCYLFFYRKERSKFFWLCLFFLGIGFLYSFLFPKGESAGEEITGLVVYKKASYYLLLTWKGTFYVRSRSETITLYSLVRLKGSLTELSFSHYESGFDFEGFLKGKGVFYQYVAKETEVLFSNPISTGLLKKYLFLYADEKSEAILSSLLFADSLYGLEESEDLALLGLSSALSLSGLHLSFFFSLLRKILGEKRTKIADILELSLTFLFLLFSGFRYSMRRIFLLTLLRIINPFFKRRLERIERVSLVAFILLIFEPYSLLSASFYYPFPLLFLLAFFPEKRKTGIKSSLLFFLKITLFYFPYRLYENSTFYLLSPVAQGLLLPYSHLLFLSGLLLFLIPPFGFVVNYLVQGYLYIADFFSGYDLYLISGRPSPFFFILYYLLFFLILLAKAYPFPGLRKTLSLTLTVCSLLLFVPDVLPKAEITAIDVDQGDCTLVRYGRVNLLIDTGGKKNVDLATECLIPYFHSRKIYSLDAVLITHQDYDHCGALESLEEHFSVKNVYYAKDFLACENQTINFGGLDIQDLNTFSTNSDEENENSAVFSFSLKDKKVLVMGDAPKEIEAKIIASHPDLDCDILKVGHHGSNTSSSLVFLETVTPSVALISCGRNNSYGHPHKETLENLKTCGAEIRRTDQEGSITYA